MMGKAFAVSRITTAPVLVFVILQWNPLPAQAELEESNSTPGLRSGAIELGLAGSWTAVEGLSRATVAVRSATFRQVPGGLGIIEMQFSYSHLRSLDWVEVQGTIGWQRRWGKSPVYPYLAGAGGLRQEWLGSFRQLRYPVGFNLGFRVLLGQQTGLRFDYGFRRILHDPVANFTEQQVVVGISIFFKNSR